MKKIIALAVIAAGIYAASFLHVEVKVSTNAAYACSTDNC